MANEIVMTKEGYDDLVKELAELKTTRRAEISEKSALHAVLATFPKTASTTRRRTNRQSLRRAF